MPYVVRIPNQRKSHVAVLTNIGPARAWRAPNHPQGCLITMGALDDMAAKLNMDPVDLLHQEHCVNGATGRQDRPREYLS